MTHHALLAPVSNMLHSSHSLPQLTFDAPPIPSGNAPIWTLLPPEIESDEDILDITGLDEDSLQTRPVFVSGYQDVARPSGEEVRVRLNMHRALSVGNAVLLNSAQRRNVTMHYPHPWSMDWKELQSLSVSLNNCWGLVWVYPTPRGRWHYHGQDWHLENGIATR